MDCQTALHMAEVCRPSGDELTHPELAPVAAHLEQCPECLALVRARQALDQRVARAMQAVLVPDGLRERIFSRLDGHARRERRRQLVVSAVAASVLIAAGVSIWANWSGRPVELTQRQIWEFVTQHGDELRNVANCPADIEDPAQVGRWCQEQLAALGLPAAPPGQLPLGLVGIARAELAGRWVAVFVFDDRRAPGDSLTHVFVCPARQFHIADLATAPVQIHPTRNPTVFAWREGEQAFVAVFRGHLPPEWERPRPPRRERELT